jgi:hypothetical protein
MRMLDTGFLTQLTRNRLFDPGEDRGALISVAAQFLEAG